MHIRVCKCNKGTLRLTESWYLVGKGVFSPEMTNIHVPSFAHPFHLFSGKFISFFLVQPVISHGEVERGLWIIIIIMFRQPLSQHLSHWDIFTSIYPVESSSCKTGRGKQSLCMKLIIYLCHMTEIQPRLIENMSYIKSILNAALCTSIPN